MTPAELKAAMIALGLSAERLARLVEASSGRTVRKWTSGERDIPGGVAVLVRALMGSRAVRRYFELAIAGDDARNDGLVENKRAPTA